jgi:hypothetical protein
MLRTDTLEESTLELLKRLQQIPLLSDLRLVGGTALALQLRHSRSIDLDFFGNINATLKDIAAMKLAAITNQGTKKDFIDFYFLLQHFSFNQMLELYKQKYTEGSLFNVIRSLTYFMDAEENVISTIGFVFVGGIKHYTSCH